MVSAQTKECPALASTAGTWSFSRTHHIMSPGGHATLSWKAPSWLLPWLRTHTKSQAARSFGSTTCWLSHSLTSFTESSFPWTCPCPLQHCQKKGRRSAEADICPWSQGGTWKVFYLQWIPHPHHLHLQLLEGFQGSGKWLDWTCGRSFWILHHSQICVILKNTQAKFYLWH